MILYVNKNIKDICSHKMSLKGLKLLIKLTGTHVMSKFIKTPLKHILFVSGIIIHQRCLIDCIRLTPPLIVLVQCQSQAWMKEEGDANDLCYYTVRLN